MMFLLESERLRVPTFQENYVFAVVFSYAFCKSLFFFSFKFYFIFKLYIILLFLPNIKMNPPSLLLILPALCLFAYPNYLHCAIQALVSVRKEDYLLRKTA